MLHQVFELLYVSKLEISLTHIQIIDEAELCLNGTLDQAKDGHSNLQEAWKAAQEQVTFFPTIQVQLYNELKPPDNYNN